MEITYGMSVLYETNYEINNRFGSLNTINLKMCYIIFKKCIIMFVLENISVNTINNSVLLTTSMVL